MKTDVIVIGAGVVGCSVARSLSRYNLNVVVLEAGSDVAEGASKANSAIVHAGFDAKPGTNKAKFNVLGNRMFEDVCRELKVPFRRNGSIVLAFGPEDEATLRELKERGESNGVPTEIISQDELRRREPNVSPDATAALWAPTGGICCPYELTPLRTGSSSCSTRRSRGSAAKVGGRSNATTGNIAKNKARQTLVVHFMHHSISNHPKRDTPPLRWGLSALSPFHKIRAFKSNETSNGIGSMPHEKSRICACSACGH